MPDFTLPDLNKFLTSQFQQVPADIREHFAQKYEWAKQSGFSYNFRELLNDMKFAHEKVVAEQAMRARV